MNQESRVNGKNLTAPTAAAVACPMLPFVYIDDYMHAGDTAFGVLDGGMYTLGDGDMYTRESLLDNWPHARFLTLEEVEQGLRKSMSTP